MLTRTRARSVGDSPARRGRGLVLAAVAAAAVWYGAFVHTPPGPRSMAGFDPDRLAALEVDMWQAYYRKERFRLFRGLIMTLREQYRYPWSRSIRAAVHLARAAVTFGDARSDYERVLPDLERAYTIARDWTGAAYDPQAVARAELAWWTARRLPGRNSPEQVGALIADEYALLYGVPRDRVAPAALLRARAARLRDDGGEQADWASVSRMLHESYRGLAVAVRGR